MSEKIDDAVRQEHLADREMRERLLTPQTALFATPFVISRLLCVPLSIWIGGRGVRNFAAYCALGCVSVGAAQDRPAVVKRADGVIAVSSDSGSVEIQAVLPNVIRVHLLPGNIEASARTLVMDPEFHAARLGDLKHGAGVFSLRTPEIRVSAEQLGSTLSALRFDDGTGKQLVTVLDPLGNGAKQTVAVRHVSGENLYGMRGTDRNQNGESFLRQSGAEVKAGIQGDGGAPLFFTTRYGVLVDSDGGEFSVQGDTVTFTRSSRKDVEFFVIAGAPKAAMGTVATLTGKAPMPPKWTLGFMNSQYGSNEDEVKTIVATYREKHLPIDAFILDFDWKAWGQDNYGEWRWNSNAGPGAAEPDKFPDGASGEFAKLMSAQGIKLAGILKPRIIVQSPTDPNKNMIAAQYAIDHGFGYPNEDLDIDYVTHKTAMNIDFNNSDARKWYWEHLEPAYDAGMAAWWNDEADYSAKVVFNNFQHVNMGRMLYEGQRTYGIAASAPEKAKRVWSINRNYYLGGLRYGYAEWSGDISTGFDIMARQRERMIASMNVGEPQWSMDTGGFSGHPDSENYARWVEFAAFVPIFRVHGGHYEKRQPWVYGPVAEAAAKSAMELRYSLMPYLYGETDEMHRTGVGLVRPMFWEYPDDAKTAAMDTEWMFGDALLVSPVVAQGAMTQSVYLPAGEWMDYLKGTRYSGGNTIDYPVDPVEWKDIPVFVRAGSIVATEAPQQYVGESPVTEIALDVFPGARVGRCNIYDDDGTDYAYEGGAFFRQEVTATTMAGLVKVSLAKPEGRYVPSFKSYRVRVHSAGQVEIEGKKVLGTAGTDKFGPYREVVVPVRCAGCTMTGGKHHTK
jgi:alpha-glucosidase